MAGGNGAQVGRAFIPIMPTMSGFRSKVSSEVKAAGFTAANGFNRAFNGKTTGSRIGSDLRNGFNASSKSMAEDVLKAYRRSVAQTTQSYKASLLEQRTAANQVKVAEESLAAAIQKHGADSTKAEAAGIRLEKARLKLQTATDKTSASELKMKDAQQQLSSAQDALTAKTVSTAVTLSSAFRNLGNIIVQPLTTAFTRIGSIVTPTLSGIAAKAKASISAAGTAMQSSASRIASPLSKTFSSMASSAASMIPTPFKNISGQIGGYLTGVGSSMRGVFSALPSAASSAASTIGSTLRSGAEVAGNALSGMAGRSVQALKSIATVGLAGVGVAVAGLASVGKSALDAYAAYEQAAGGVDTLFKGASSTVQQYASQAYKTAGVSATQYMQQVTSFSASLISSLGGDTAKAAELGNTAMVDMSDNANKMGTSIDTIQQTYQSLARGNYAMLDNLKLGYGGTKSEMERMISDANRVKEANGEMGDLSVDKFSDVVQAIHIMQGQLGITGTTSKEAATTIEGSVGMMKAAWQNWLTELGKDNADIEGLTSQLVGSVGTVIENIGPRIGQIIEGITAALPQLFSSLGSTLPALVRQILPPVLDALGQLGSMLLTNAAGWMSTGLPQLLSQFQAWVTSSLPSLIASGMQSLTSFLQGIVDNLPQITSTAITVMLTLLNGLFDQLPTLIPIGVQAIVNLIQGIVSKLPDIIDSGLRMMAGLAQGIANSMPQVVAKAPQLIGQLVSGFISRLPQILQTGIQILGSLASGFVSSIPSFLGQIPGMIGQIISAFTSVNWGQVGLNIITGIASGLKNAAGKLVDAAVNAAKDALNWVKEKLGIHSPSRVFRDQVGRMIGEGMAVGIESSVSKVRKAAGRLTDILPAQSDYQVNASLAVPSASRFAGVATGNQTTVNAPITINTLDGQLAGRIAAEQIRRAVA